LDGRALLEKVREELAERAGIQHAARDTVRADLGGLLEECDGDVAQSRRAARFLVAREKLGQPERAGQACRTSADEQDVHFEDVARLVPVHDRRAAGLTALGAAGSAWAGCFSSSRYRSASSPAMPPEPA